MFVLFGVRVIAFGLVVVLRSSDCPRYWSLVVLLFLVVCVYVDIVRVLVLGHDLVSCYLLVFRVPCSCSCYHVVALCYCYRSLFLFAVPVLVIVLVRILARCYCSCLFSCSFYCSLLLFLFSVNVPVRDVALVVCCCY